MVLIKTSAHNKVLVVAVHLHRYTASWPYSSLTLLEALALKKLLFKYFIVFKAPFLHSLYQGLFRKVSTVMQEGVPLFVHAGQPLSLPLSASVPLVRPLGVLLPALGARPHLHPALGTYQVVLLTLVDRGLGGDLEADWTLKLLLNSLDLPFHELEKFWIGLRHHLRRLNWLRRCLAFGLPEHSL